MKRILLALLIAFAASSCGKDFIELSPITAASSNTFYQNSTDMQNAINAAYGVLQSAGIYGNQYMFGDIPTDDAVAAVGTCVGGACDFDNFTVTSNSSASANILNGRWNDAYRGIYRCNSLLDRIDAIEMTDELKNRIKGEAHFLRGLYYFLLAQTFGDVPLVINEIKTIDEAYNFPRTAVADVYAQIQQDLQAAATALPLTYNSNADAGRATKGAAQGLLARVLLFQRKFPEALPLLKTVIDSDVYSLLPGYADVFRHDNGNNAEIVFAVQYTRGGVGEGNAIMPNFAPVGSGNSVIIGGGNSFNQPTLDIEAAYEAGDMRKDATIAAGYTNSTGQYVETFFVTKFLDPAMTIPFETGVDYPVIRYSDILLMYAECLNEGGQTPEAHTYLNRVRNRAGLADLGGLSQDAMRLALEHERRVEFAFEGLRFFDLVRTNRMIPVLNQYFIDYNIQVLGQVIQVSEIHKIFPVPQAQIDINPIITQNQGYQ